MSRIHPSAHVDPGAILAPGVRVGPGAAVGAGVCLGEDCEVGAHTILEGPAVLGPGCRVFPGAVIGAEAQVVKLKGPGGAATIHRSMHEGKTTRVGAGCYLMVGSHVAHDCQVGDRVILSNGITLGGHVEVGDDCFVTNFIGVHQFVRIGPGVLLAGPSGVRKDVPPYTTVEGHPPRVRGLNVVGLRRREVPAEVRAHLKRAYRILFQEAKTAAEAAARIEAELPAGREIQTVIQFIRSSERGIYQGAV
ncbi:MAG: acyl-ACP--UDP-N-acetylglucosamine O-acyltransferase [Candidatus Tectomicrobia bacterium]|nr:acyl-ACP--UDP-N-acetylglucosamine O-acyltransferase [Candidatus Tectomicrobia bacterium]